MADDKGDDDSQSTIVRRGKEAFSFVEMGTFVRSIEARPLAKLVDDLPGLLDLSDAKFSLVLLAVGKRMRAGGEEQAAIVAKLEALKKTGSELVQKRAETLLKPG
jgi:hypothetical protein